MARRGNFGFDLSKPIKTGRLLKQGYFHKAFKYREFVLYPGFLVYYRSVNDWKLDVTKGALGSRIGALKLKGSIVSIANNAPKGCKFGLLVTAPDPANKRQLYLMNAASKEERDAWINAIFQAVPTTTPTQQKELAKSKEEPKTKSCSDDALTHPTLDRHNTAYDAAVEVATNLDPEEEQREVDEFSLSLSISMEELLHKKNNATTMATLLLDQELLKGVEEDPETSIDVVLHQMKAQHRDSQSSDDSSIDNICMKESTSSSDGSVSTTNTSRVTSLTSELSNSMHLDSEQEHLPPSSPASSAAAVQDIILESHKSARWSQDSNDEATAGTITSEGCTSMDSPKSERRNHDENGDAVETEREGENLEGEKKKATSSRPDKKRERCFTYNITRVLLNDKAQRLSLNLKDIDSDNTLSGEETISDWIEDETEKGEEGEMTNGSPPLATADMHLGPITVKEDRTGSSSSSSSSSSYNSPSHSSQQTANPRASATPSATPFTEKRGFLYKMGGQRKNWRPRFFVLRPGSFQYFKDSSCRKLLGEVKLNKLNIFYPGVGERKQAFQFKVHTECTCNRRPDYMLAAQSEREMKEWIAAFKCAGKKIDLSLTSVESN